MSVTDELLARYAESFSGPLPLPPARGVAHIDCGMLTFTDDGFKASIQDETGIKPAWAAEAFSDPDADVRQSIARIKASPFVPKTDSIRGFVFDVATGKLNEVV